MPGATRSCCKCHISGPKEEMAAKNGKWYCKSCLEESSDYEAFANEICKIFGVKMPGPKINAKRAQLKKRYGYTDRVILNTFRYCHDVKGMKNLTQTFGIIGPQLIEEAKNYMATKDIIQNDTLVAVTNIEYVEHYKPRKTQEKFTPGFDILEHLEDDVFAAN